jgi:CelD/BcsL family acetyltransferase involved in cellulose biosynthesis
MNDLTLPDAPIGATGSRRLSGARIEIVSTRQDFLALRREWDELFQRAAEPQQVFQNFAFLEAWTHRYLDDRLRLHIVLARQDRRLEAIVPLVRQRRFGLQILRFMGTPVAQFDDAIIAPGMSGELRGALWRTIETSGADLLDARRVRADAALRRLLPAHSIPVEILEAPFADLQIRVDDDGLGKAYSARDRSSHRRRMRRLADIGEVSSYAALPGPEAARLAGEAVDLKRAWLRANGLASPTVTDPRFRAFFVETASMPGSALRVSAIAIDGKPVAIDLSFDCKGRTFGHVIATDAGYEREGLGQLLIHHVFATAKSRGSTAFELMTPLDDYKRRHADGLAKVESLIVPFSHRGRLLARTVFRHGLPAAKSLVRRLPLRLRRLLVR